MTNNGKSRLMYQGSIINHKKEALQVSENMKRKNRNSIRAIIIILSVFALIIVTLSFCLMMHLVGVSKEKTEAEARAFHNIDESWQCIQATSDDVSAMLFFPSDRSSHFYSIYSKHKGLSNGYFFRIGGTISEISSECVQFVFEDYNSHIYASMNKQKICKVEIDDGDHVNTILLNEDDPFILVFPSNAGNVTLYNIYGEVVAPMKRDVP